MRTIFHSRPLQNKKQKSDENYLKSDEKSVKERQTKRKQINERHISLEEERFQTTHWCNTVGKPTVCGGLMMKQILIIIVVWKHF